jgi:flagellar hook assembly protein FlgD
LWDRTALGSRRLAGPLFVAALVLASLGALVLNQELRRQGLVLDRIHITSAFSVGGIGTGSQAKIRFRIKGPDRITLDIVDASGRRVRRLAQDRQLPNRRKARFLWNGLDDAGRPAPPGEYRLQIRILGRHRTITPDEQIVLNRSRAGS